jgi:hypothetical protein
MSAAASSAAAFERKKMTTSAQRVRIRGLSLGLLLSAAALAGASLSIAPSVAHARDDSEGGKVTVRITGTNDRRDVTNGGVAGVGRFTASGAITDKGAVTGYRTVKGALITLRFVSVGKKGTITFVVKIKTNIGSSRWTIASGTKAYKGLHGKGTEHENADFTASTLTGTVSR